MISWLKYCTLICLALITALPAAAVEPQNRTFTFDNSWGEPGFTVTSSGDDGLTLVFSLPSVTLTPMSVRGEAFSQVIIPGSFLPTNPGEPNLPGNGRFVALPQGAKVKLEILESRTSVLPGVNVLPSARIPLDTEQESPLPEKDPAIYQRDAAWPAQQVQLSGPMKIRGIDARTLGITPFAYNPVSDELTVYTDLKIRLTFEGGTGTFGDDRLRSRYWDPILAGQLLNFDRLAAVDYSSRDYTGRSGVEYIIIVPDDEVFITWGQAIADFRTLQGISSQVYTVTEVGGNYPTAIEDFIDDAYDNWDPAPVAVLFLGDYVSPGQPGGVTSPENGYYITDNIYADVDGDHLPELVSARITARNAGELSIMINKFLDYEWNPPTAPNFYHEPLVACGFQTERWFQICTEIVRGFWVNELGKDPVRQYNVYYGSPGPGQPWSSNQNTYMLVDYFGTAGLNYIPDTQPDIDWNSGSAAGINAAINSGCFILQHRDHGSEGGWGEPDYQMSDLAGLSNEMLPWVFSINCLTGKFDDSSEVFAEAFHRMEGGALGVTAATDVSYSFVNDTYVFGSYDSMWPDFDPGYPTAERAVGQADMRPAFANTSGKYYLEASNWPYNPDSKEITYYLFHSHSDAFTTLYSEVPSTMSVAHGGALLSMLPVFPVTAPAGSVIALTRDGEILGVADGTGAPVNVEIPGQLPGPPAVKVTVTKANHYRYEADVEVIPQSGAYVSYEIHSLDDDDSGYSSGNGDGIATPGETIELELGLKNYGLDPAYGVTATVSSASAHILFLDESADYGDVAPDQSVMNPDPIVFEVLSSCPHGEEIQIDVDITDGVDLWESTFFFTVEAGQIVLQSYVMTDYPEGNNDGDVDMGESVYLELVLENVGAVYTTNVSATLTSNDPGYVTVLEGTAVYPDIPAGGTASSESPHYYVAVDLSTPCGTTLSFDLNVSTDQGAASDQLEITVGGNAPVYQWDMSSNPGWATEGQWAWGPPTGGGGDYGNPDPTSGATGPNVYGYNLSGDYTNSMPEYHLTSTSFDCTGMTEVSVSFQRYLNVEQPYYDHAYLRVSNNGSSWTTVWENSAEVTDSSWSMVEYDISDVADNQSTVYLRWTMGTTDSSWTYSGWNIDDVQIAGVICQPWYGGGGDTVAVDIACVPGSGELPFATNVGVQVENLTTYARAAAGNMSIELAAGTIIDDYRSGQLTLAPLGTFTTSWSQWIPSHQSVVGDNVFTLVVEDVTPAPYNQPPYPASGDTDSAACTVTASSP